MKFVFDTASLRDAISTAAKANAAQTTNKAYQEVLFDIADGKTTIRALNGEMGISTFIDNEGTGSQKICIETKAIQPIVNKLNGDTTSFEIENGKVVVRSGKARFTLVCGDGSNFPSINVDDDNQIFDIDASVLAKVLKGVIFSADSGNTQQMMRAVNMVIDGGVLTATCLDGHRVARRWVNVDTTNVVVANIPVTSIKALLAFMKRGIVKVELGEKFISFTTEQGAIVTRLVDGKFFNVDSIVNGSKSVSIEVDRKELLETIERANLVSDMGTTTPVVVKFGENKINISAKSSLSDMDEDVDATITVAPNGWDTIGFNPRFLNEMLKEIEDERITLEFNNAKSPCFATGDEYVYLALPVNIR